MDEKTRMVLEIASTDLPIVSRPFDEWSREIGVDPDEMIRILKEARGAGIVRRFGAIIGHTQSGLVENAMVAWLVPEGRADEVGTFMAQSPAISHCYLRESTESWPYNLYTMIHASTSDALHSLVRALADRCALDDFVVLETVRELKKISPPYLSRGDG